MTQISITVCDQDGKNPNCYFIDDDQKLESLKMKVEQRVGWMVQSFFYNGKATDFDKSLKFYKIVNNDILAVDLLCELKLRESVAEFKRYKSLEEVPPRVYLNPDLFETCFRANHRIFALLKTKNEVLADAVMSRDKPLLSEILLDYSIRYHNRHSVSGNSVGMISQKNIEDDIRKRNLEDNLINAIEHAPELFVNVEMLYVPVFVNGVKVNAFVDSGAQRTIMSKSCAERTGLVRLIDGRFHGIAKGVGTAKILGRVHMAEMRIGRNVLNCSLNILESDSVDFLLGLDMMKRHLMEIDLKKNVLRINGDETQFVSNKSN